MATVGKHGLRAAYREWWHGRPVGEQQLWLGHSVLAWGRLGKFLEFVAALTIIAELVGKTELNNLGNSLSHSTFGLQLLQHHIDAVIPSGAVIGVAGLISNISSRRYERKEILTVDTQGKVTVEQQFGSSKKSVSGIAGSIVLVACYLLVISVVVINVAAYAAFGFAWTLERSDIVTWIKIGSILLLVLGFHFDFLAS